MVVAENDRQRFSFSQESWPALWQAHRARSRSEADASRRIHVLSFGQRHLADRMGAACLPEVSRCHIGLVGLSATGLQIGID